MRWCLSILAALAATATIPAVRAANAQNGDAFDHESWRIAVAETGLDPTDVVYPFDSSPEMVAWAEAVMDTVGGLAPRLRLFRLQQAMFEGDTFDFAYDNLRTLTAEGAFETRRGNCMSFTALFIAMSRSVGIPTFLMTVRRDPDIDRDDGLVIINRHIVAAHRSGGQVTTYDFYLSSDAKFVSRRVIDDVRASAMYHTNLGGDALRNDDFEEARRNLVIATTLAPDWAAGWVNLGVTLARLDDVEGAFFAYRQALDVDSGNSSALNNLSSLYERLGRDSEARVALRAAAEQTESPFTLVAMADSEMLYGNNREAAKYLKRAKRWYPREPEVYEGLARLAHRTGDTRREEKYLRKASKLRSVENGDS